MNVWNPAGRGQWIRLPLSKLFQAICWARRAMYRAGWLTVASVDVPVIVIGNITVGGSGKTPFAIWLVDRLKEWGWRPGVASRGYGGRYAGVASVMSDSDPQDVGDEPVLLARRTGCPVIVARKRSQAAEQLVALGCDIIVCDDGLQHYGFRRDLEIAMVDGARRFGNGRMLPAGPLREPLSRLDSVDLVVAKGRPTPGEFGMDLNAICWRNGVDRRQRREITHFNGQTAHAVAGIANPHSFFESLRQIGIRVIEHPFPDHHAYVAADLQFHDTLPILMTEKDAVKCAGLASSDPWYLEVEACLDTAFVAALHDRITQLKRKS